MFEQLLGRCQFPEPGERVRCGVSGGADSIAMLVLATKAQLEVTAVHVDHQLRPGSAGEAGLVAETAARFGARFESASVSVEPGPDLEQRARQARHAILGPTAMTAHTADDQAETVLINLLRGSGISGLSGIAPGYRHPILDLRRAETEAVCAAVGIEPFEDPSNRDRRFVRNRVRAELLPLMADIADRDVVPLLARTAQHAYQTRLDLNSLATDLDPTDSRLLSQVPVTLAHEALRLWLSDDLGHQPSSADIERVMTVVRHERVACELPGGRRIARSDGVLRVEKR